MSQLRPSVAKWKICFCLEAGILEVPSHSKSSEFLWKQLVGTQGLWGQPQLDDDSACVILKVPLDHRWKWCSKSVSEVLKILGDVRGILARLTAWKHWAQNKTRMTFSHGTLFCMFYLHSMLQRAFITLKLGHWAVMLTQMDLVDELYFFLKYMFLLSLLAIWNICNENHLQSNVFSIVHCVVTWKDCASVCRERRVPLCYFLLVVCR